MTDLPTRCLLTGAAGGLGRSIAVELRRRGLDLHLVDREEGPLRALAAELGARFSVIDLTDDTAIPALFETTPDIVINAIGRGFLGTVEELDDATFRRSFDVNFFAPLFVGLAAVRRWSERAMPGRLLTLSSISGWKAYSSSVAYAAAKHALESGMRILRDTAAASPGIHVGTICPTNVDTAFWQAVENGPSVELPDRSAMLDPGEVARSVATWLDRPRPPAVVFVPAGLARMRTRYGRAPSDRCRGRIPPSGVALVTGASAGLGRELVRRLRARDWRVVAIARDATRLAAEFDDDDAVCRCPGDVADGPRMRAIVGEAVQRFGGIDLLVNNAGSSRIGSALALAPADIRRVFDTNFYGYLHVTKAALPHLQRPGSSGGDARVGSILNILSVTALRPAPTALPYSCAKLAQAVVADRLGEDVAGRGVRVVDLFPGNIRTEFFTRAETEDGGHVPMPANAMDVGEVADAAMAVLDGRAATAVVPRHFDRRTLRHRLRRLLLRP